jgi:hypothetical protein
MPIEKSHDSFEGLDAMLPNDTPKEFRRWWGRVQRTAKELCNDPSGRLININILLAHEGETKSEDVEKGRDCVKRAIEHHLKSMPNIEGQLYMQIIKNLGGMERR